jgi:hypothetical protein
VPNSRSGGNEFESPVRQELELGAQTKSGKTLEVMYIRDRHTNPPSRQPGGRGGGILPVRKKMFHTGPFRAAKAELKSLVPARRAQQTNKKEPPCIMHVGVPIYNSSTHSFFLF